MFELRRDPVTGWWSAVVTDRTFEHSSFAVEAAPVEGTHCRHCDDAAPDEIETTVRRVTLRANAFHRIDSSKESAAQMSLSEVEASGGSWRSSSARAATTSGWPTRHRSSRLPCCAPCATRCATSAQPRAMGDDAPRAAQIQSCRATVASGLPQPHLNLELYAIPQVPHWLAEEIGGGARHFIKTRGCVWCGLARAEEEMAASPCR